LPQSILAAQVLTVPSPLSSATPQRVPVTLDALVAKALAKSPAERYATAAQMAAALERVLANLTETSRLHVPLPAPSSFVERRTEDLFPPRAPAAATALPQRPRNDTQRMRRAERGLSRAAAIVRRYGPAALAAVLSGVLFFALLWTVWRILRGPS